MTRRLAHSHSLGAGLVLGLLVAQRPLWIFAAGVVGGIALVFAARVVRRLIRVGGLGLRWLERKAETPNEASAERAPLVASVLSLDERERERVRGLRQGVAAGIRAAAREEVRESAKREAMDEALERHWREQRHRSIRDVVQPSTDGAIAFCK